MAENADFPTPTEQQLDRMIELAVRRAIAQELTEHRDYIGHLSKYTASAAVAILLGLVAGLIFFFGNTLETLEGVVEKQVLKQAEEFTETKINVAAESVKLLIEETQQAFAIAEDTSDKAGEVATEADEVLDRVKKSLAIVETAPEFQDRATLITDIKNALMEDQGFSKSVAEQLETQIQQIESLFQRIDAGKSNLFTVSGFLTVDGSAEIPVPEGTTTNEWEILLYPLALGMFSQPELERSEGNFPPEFRPISPKDGWLNEAECWAYPAVDQSKWIVRARQNLQNNVRSRTHPVDVRYFLIRRRIPL